MLVLTVLITTRRSDLLVTETRLTRGAGETQRFVGGRKGCGIHNIVSGGVQQEV